MKLKNRKTELLYFQYFVRHGLTSSGNEQLKKKHITVLYHSLKKSGRASRNIGNTKVQIQPLGQFFCFSVFWIPNFAAQIHQDLVPLLCPLALSQGLKSTMHAIFFLLHLKFRSSTINRAPYRSNDLSKTFAIMTMETRLYGALI